MPLAIAVYCSSSENVGQEYFAEARTLGKLIGTHGHSLVYGGCAIGLMGEVARATKVNGGKVLGVIPHAIHSRGLAYDACDELMVTPSMHERKLEMENRADAYVALPGGFGTLEEFVQVLTLKSLHYHKKPIVLINLNGFYDPLLLLFNHFVEHRFARTEIEELYKVVADAGEVIPYLEQYAPPVELPKWFEKQG
jgi:cytokinin riboside 5'-monophosphate phosphoribohydrolase